jgi:hypothetical protein
MPWQPATRSPQAQASGGLLSLATRDDPARAPATALITASSTAVLILTAGVCDGGLWPLGHGDASAWAPSPRWPAPSLHPSSLSRPEPSAGSMASAASLTTCMLCEDERQDQEHLRSRHAHAHGITTSHRLSLHVVDTQNPQVRCHLTWGFAEPPKGIEPLTYALRVRRSGRLS